MTICSSRSPSPSRIAAALLLVAACSAGLLPVHPAPATPLEEHFAVVVSSDVPVDSLTLDQLRHLFLFREKYWKHGRPVRIILPETQLEPGSFLLERIYRMDYAALRRLILEKVYQEQIDLAPRVVASDSVALDYVAAGRGLLSLVRFSATNGKVVRMVAIDGVAPGSPTYSLRR